MNTQRALNGTFHGLRAYRGEPSTFAHALLAGLEALAQEAMWRTPYCGGNDEVRMYEGSVRLALEWTDVVWQRGGRHE